MTITLKIQRGLLRYYRRRFKGCISDMFTEACKPNYCSLRIDIADNCRPERRHGLEQMRSVEVDFADVGVQVEWGVDIYQRTREIPQPIVSPVLAPVVSPSADSSSPIKTESPRITTETPTARRGWRKVTPRFHEGISSFRSMYPADVLLFHPGPLYRIKP